jgi:hypothetical protein
MLFLLGFTPAIFVACCKCVTRTIGYFEDGKVCDCGDAGGGELELSLLNSVIPPNKIPNIAISVM